MLTAFLYIYDATGRKVRKVVQNNVLSQNTVTDYANGFQYENNIVQFFPTAEGYVTRLTTKIEETGRLVKIPIEELPEDQFSYVYNYTDHLGNIRLSYAQDPDTQQLKIVEQNHYYPFGLRHTNYSGGKMQVVKEQEFKRMAPTPEELLSYKYKYNGKEWQDELGLNFYDYGARNYDPAIGRWMNIDPKAEADRRWTPYRYAYNNPLRFIDPDGMLEEWVDESGNAKVDSKGNYTKYATKQDKEFGDALKNSGEEGAKAFEHLTKSQAQITVEFHNEPTGGVDGDIVLLGYTDIGTLDNGYTIENGNAVLQKAKIDVYVATCNDYANAVKNGEKPVTSSDTSYDKATKDLVKNENVTGFDLAVAIFGHEIGHTKNRNVYQRHIERKGGSTDNINSLNEQLGSELSPLISQVKILQDLAKK